MSSSASVLTALRNYPTRDTVSQQEVLRRGQEVLADQRAFNKLGNDGELEYSSSTLVFRLPTRSLRTIRSPVRALKDGGLHRDPNLSIDLRTHRVS